MRKTILYVLIVIVISVPVYGEIVNGIACKVSSTIITINEFNTAYNRAKLQAMLIGSDVPEKKTVMDGLINNLIIQMEAEEKGIIVTEDELDVIVSNIMEQNNLTYDQFLEELEKEGLSIDELKEIYRIDILRGRLINQMVSAKMNVVTESEIQEFYDDPSNRRLFTNPESVKLSQIYISVPENVSYKEALEIKNQAVEVYERAKSGESFTDLVLMYSMSPEKEKNLGSIGSFTRKQLLNIMTEDGVNLIFTLEQGEVSPPLRFFDGYYIMRVDEKNEEKVLSFEEAYESIKSFLTRKKGEEMLQDWLVSKRNGIKVQYMIEME